MSIPGFTDNLYCYLYYNNLFEYQREQEEKERRLIKIKEIDKETEDFEYNPDAYCLVSKRYKENDKHKFNELVKSYKKTLINLKYFDVKDYYKLYEDKLKFVEDYIKIYKSNIDEYIATNQIIDYIIIDNFGLTEYFKLMKKMEKKYNIVELTRIF